MGEVTPIKTGKDLTNKKAEETAIKIVASEHAEKVAIQAKDAEGIRKSVEKILSSERAFAAIYRAEFPKHLHRDATDVSYQNGADWCASFGFHVRKVQRWGEKLLDGDFDKELKERTAKCMKIAGMADSPHVGNNSGENEWYTPPKIIEAARNIMGSIDCDPASSERANKAVKAKIFFTAKEDGLKQKWKGNVWLNPPYAQPLISHFCDTLLNKWKSNEIKQACLLVNNATETSYLQPLMEECDAILFPAGRIKFIDKNGEPTGAPLQGQMILYFGPNKDLFQMEMIQGVVLFP